MQSQFSVVKIKIKTKVNLNSSADNLLVMQCLRTAKNVSAVDDFAAMSQSGHKLLSNVDDWKQSFLTSAGYQNRRIVTSTAAVGTQLCFRPFRIEQQQASETYVR